MVLIKEERFLLMIHFSIFLERGSTMSANTKAVTMGAKKPREVGSPFNNRISAIIIDSTMRDLRYILMVMMKEMS